MTVKEFWAKLKMAPAEHSSKTVLWFDGEFIASGSAMAMKETGEDLLQKYIREGKGNN